jgi:hypothetical protein
MLLAISDIRVEYSSAMRVKENPQNDSRMMKARCSSMRKLFLVSRDMFASM